MIKTLIFDFGDVFINLDKEATISNITQHFGKFLITPELEHTNNQYETGHISTHAFINFYKTYFRSENEEFLKYAWNSIILDFPQHRLEFLKAMSIRKQYKLILLSNTNELHIEQVKKNMTLDRYLEFKDCFDVFYLSHKIGFRKPNLDIFKFVISENNLNARECFYIEDTLEHTIAAAQLGIRSWTINPDCEDVTELFEKHKHMFMND